jgi:hypothetical protein
MANNNPHHYFHAEADALTAKLQTPFEAQIKPQAFVKIEGDSRKILLEGEEFRKVREKKAPENYFSEQAKNYHHEQIFSFSAAHTQVSGHRSRKHPGAFVTLATSYVEKLNVLNVVTADRVVAQISTTHFPNQYSPEVTFLGTHFENLRIARHQTEPLLNLAFAGSAPTGKNPYYPSRGTDFMESVERQNSRMRDAVKRLKSAEREAMRLDVKDSWLSRQYHGFSNFDYKDLLRRAQEAAKKDDECEAPVSNGGKWEGVRCSLVEHVEIEDIEIPRRDQKPIVIPPPARSFGHVIHVPDFGTIFLAELKVNHNSFHLTMIRLELGCIADGTGSFVTCNVNGGGKGSGGH